MRVAVIGSRQVTEEAYSALCEKIPVGASEIISGGAAGADALAERYAQEHHLVLTVIPPDYEAFGRRAPLVRTEQIVHRADYLLALWNGASRGTAYAIDFCLKTQTPVRVIPCDTSEKGEKHA